MKERITEETTKKIVKLATEMSNATASKWIWKGLNEDKVIEAEKREDEAYKKLMKLLIKLEISEV